MDEQGQTNADYGDRDHTIDTGVVAVDTRTKEEIRADQRMEVIANCVRCAAAQKAGYATCASHRPIEFNAAVVAHAYVTQDGAAHDVEMQTERNALRTWRPQHVHYHGATGPCNDRCHVVFPNDLPVWGGSNIE